MEPLDLTCAKCNATWKLIKAAGAIACPYCNAVVDSPKITSSSAAMVPAPVSSEVNATAEKPAENSVSNEVSPPVPASFPVSPTDANSIPSFARQARQSVNDADDPGVRADYDDRYDAKRRSGMHPLLRVCIILMILLILVPVAVVILVAVVCAAMWR